MIDKDRQKLLEALNQPLLRFVAKGNTFPHRELFRSYAWHWNQERRLWINENEISVDDYCIQAFTNLPGIEIICEGPIE